MISYLWNKRVEWVVGVWRQWAHGWYRRVVGYRSGRSGQLSDLDHSSRPKAYPFRRGNSNQDRQGTAVPYKMKHETYIRVHSNLAYSQFFQTQERYLPNASLDSGEILRPNMLISTTKCINMCPIIFARAKRLQLSLPTHVVFLQFAVLKTTRDEHKPTRSVVEIRYNISLLKLQHPCGSPALVSYLVCFVLRLLGTKWGNNCMSGRSCMCVSAEYFARGHGEMPLQCRKFRFKHWLVELEIWDDAFLFGSSSLQGGDLLDNLGNVQTNVLAEVTLHKSALSTHQPSNTLRTQQQQRLQAKFVCQGTNGPNPNACRHLLAVFVAVCEVHLCSANCHLLWQL